MIYLNQTEFAARFDDLAEFPPAEVTAALEDANGLAAGYVEVLYPAFVTVPHLLRAACSDIARRKLYKFEVPTGVQKAADDALKTLRDIASGVITLPRTGAIDPTQTESLIFSGCEVRRMGTRQFGYHAGVDDDEDTPWP